MTLSLPIIFPLLLCIKSFNYSSLSLSMLLWYTLDIWTGTILLTQSILIISYGDRNALCSRTRRSTHSHMLTIINFANRTHTETLIKYHVSKTQSFTHAHGYSIILRQTTKYYTHPNRFKDQLSHS